MTSIFVPAVGQYDNIGDIILRRPLLDTLRPLGALHLYLGDCPAGYIDGLSLSPSDVTYRSFGSWYRALLSAAGRGEAHYVFKPGEIQLTLRGMKEHVGMLPALLMVRLRGGRVVRVGSGARSFARLPRLLMRPSIALSQLVIWRDRATANFLGGETMPDFGFVAGAPLARAERNLLVVSLRGDRAMPDATWIAGVRLFAEEHALEIVVVTQVGRDSERTRQVASALDARTLDWDGVGHREQEAALRATYNSARAVVSDRLHVLIAAATEGAYPVGLLTTASDKIDRHFSAAGFPRVATTAAGLSSREIADEIVLLAFGSERHSVVLRQAQESISLVRSRVAALISGTGPA